MFKHSDLTGSSLIAFPRSSQDNWEFGVTFGAPLGIRENRTVTVYEKTMLFVGFCAEAVPAHCSGLFIRAFHRGILKVDVEGTNGQPTGEQIVYISYEMKAMKKPGDDSAHVIAPEFSFTLKAGEDKAIVGRLSRTGWIKFDL